MFKAFAWVGILVGNFIDEYLLRYLTLLFPLEVILIDWLPVNCITQGLRKNPFSTGYNEKYHSSWKNQRNLYGRNVAALMLYLSATRIHILTEARAKGCQGKWNQNTVNWATCVIIHLRMVLSYYFVHLHEKQYLALNNITITKHWLNTYIHTYKARRERCKLNFLGTKGTKWEPRALIKIICISRSRVYKWCMKYACWCIVSKPRNAWGDYYQKNYSHTNSVLNWSYMLQLHISVCLIKVKCHSHEYFMNSST